MQALQLFANACCTQSGGSRRVHNRSSGRGSEGSGCAPVEGRTILGGSGAPCSSVSSAYLKMKSNVLVVTLHSAVGLECKGQGQGRLLLQASVAHAVSTNKRNAQCSVLSGSTTNHCNAAATSGALPNQWPDKSAATTHLCRFSGCVTDACT